jgi:hypothetical protein
MRSDPPKNTAMDAAFICVHHRPACKAVIHRVTSGRRAGCQNGWRVTAPPLVRLRWFSGSVMEQERAKRGQRLLAIR